MNAQCRVVFATLITSAWTQRILILACAEAVLNTRSRKIPSVVLVSLFTFLVNRDKFSRAD